MTDRGTLYVVGTPLGNLEDHSSRSARVLGEVSLIVAEDTRRLRSLTSGAGFRARLLSLPAPREASRIPQVLAHLASGASAALVTDAGMPGISDPGARLVRAARDGGFPVVPVAGPSAVTAALAASGLPADSFLFLGFLPVRGAARRRALEEIARSPRTCVLFEAPHRLRATLVDLGTACGDRRYLVIARELTKLYEEISAGPVAELIAGLPERVRGEITLVVEGSRAESGSPSREPSDPPPEAPETVVARLLAQGASPAHAARDAARLLGRPRRELYGLAVALQNEATEPSDG